LETCAETSTHSTQEGPFCTASPGEKPVRIHTCQGGLRFTLTGSPPKARPGSTPALVVERGERVSHHLPALQRPSSDAHADMAASSTARTCGTPLTEHSQARRLLHPAHRLTLRIKEPNVPLFSLCCYPNTQEISSNKCLCLSPVLPPLCCTPVVLSHHCPRSPPLLWYLQNLSASCCRVRAPANLPACLGCLHAPLLPLAFFFF